MSGRGYKYGRGQFGRGFLEFARILVLIVGLCIGGYLVYQGVAKPGTPKVEELRVQLETKKASLSLRALNMIS